MKKVIINFKNWPSIASEHSFEMTDDEIKQSKKK